MSRTLRILIVEDSEDDVLLLLLTLRRGGYDVIHDVVATPEAMRAALARQPWDLITSDHAMPHFSAPAALALAKQLCPDVPFIIVSGEIDLNLAVSLMKGSAQDYIQKRELPRLIPAIQRVLQEGRLRRERQEGKDAIEVSETRYRRLFETAQDGILILDANTGQIEDVNPFLMDMLGYSREAFLGKQLWEIGCFRDRETSQAAFRQLQTCGYVRYEDLPLETHQGKAIAVEFVSNVYLVDGLRVAQCNIRDITARKEAENEIKRLNAELEHRVEERTSQLEALNEELEAFNYSVSHDLHAPLRRIVGFVEALRSHGADQHPDRLPLIQSIRVSVDRMAALIEALLHLARLSQGTLQRQPVDLSAAARRIAADLRQGHPDRQVDFVIPSGITAQGDAQLLLIVLENLMGNAWKFSARQSSARIEFGSETQADGTVTYYVRDNGAGFDPTYADRLFSPFQRLHSDQEFPGLGIGLATVRRIMRRHGGRVWAEGAVDQGAAVFFSVGGPVNGHGGAGPTTAGGRTS